MKHCVCGMAVEEREIPPLLRAAHRGRKTILVHVATNDARCYPDALKESDRNATVVIDENYEEDYRPCQ